MTKILIASPTYDGSVRKEYMQSIMRLTDYFRQAGIAWEILLEPATVLHVMRSVMASKALMEDDITHLLFVDTDMGFPVAAVRKLLELGKDVIGCASPYRTVPLHEPVKAASESLRMTISEMVPYNVTFSPDTRSINVDNSICEVKSVGTGIMLISKQALRLMQQKGDIGSFVTSFPYSQYYKAEKYYGFFEHMKIDGAYIGEDYSFCLRWANACGGKIYAVVDEEILHIGALPVLGRYVDKLRTGKL